MSRAAARASAASAASSSSLSVVPVARLPARGKAHKGFLLELKEQIKTCSESQLSSMQLLIADELDRCVEEKLALEEHEEADASAQRKLEALAQIASQVASAGVSVQLQDWGEVEGMVYADSKIYLQVAAAVGQKPVRIVGLFDSPEQPGWVEQVSFKHPVALSDSSTITWRYGPFDWENGKALVKKFVFLYFAKAPKQCPPVGSSLELFDVRTDTFENWHVLEEGVFDQDNQRMFGRTAWHSHPWYISHITAPPSQITATPATSKQKANSATQARS